MNGFMKRHPPGLLEYSYPERAGLTQHRGECLAKGERRHTLGALVCPEEWARPVVACRRKCRFHPYVVRQYHPEHCEWHAGALVSTYTGYTRAPR